MSAMVAVRAKWENWGPGQGDCGLQRQKAGKTRNLQSKRTEDTGGNVKTPLEEVMSLDARNVTQAH